MMGWSHTSKVGESWTVRQVMSAPVHSAAPATGVKQLVRTLREHRISALPVVDGEGRLLGVVSEADVLVTRGGGVTAADLMTAPAVAVGPDLEVSEAARLMREKGVRRLIVVDDDGRVIGIASRADLLKVYLRDDDAIKRDVQAIVRDVLWLDVSLGVQVSDGKVGIHGKVPRRSDGNLIKALARRLPGVVAVESAIAYDQDDTKLPSHPWDLWFRVAASSQGGEEEVTY